MPCSLAMRTGSPDGSTPRNLTPAGIYAFNSVPSLEPKSTANWSGPRDSRSVSCRARLCRWRRCRLRGAADERKIFIDHRGVDGVAELAQPAIRAVVKLHRVENFRFIQLRLVKNQIADRLMSQVETWSGRSTADLTSNARSGAFQAKSAFKTAASFGKRIQIEHHFASYRTAAAAGCRCTVSPVRALSYPAKTRFKISRACIAPSSERSGFFISERK